MSREEKVTMYVDALKRDYLEQFKRPIELDKVIALFKKREDELEDEWIEKRIRSSFIGLDVTSALGMLEMELAARADVKNLEGVTSERAPETEDNGSATVHAPVGVPVLSLASVEVKEATHESKDEENRSAEGDSLDTPRSDTGDKAPVRSGGDDNADSAGNRPLKAHGRKTHASPGE